MKKEISGTEFLKNHLEGTPQKNNNEPTNPNFESLEEFGKKFTKEMEDDLKRFEEMKMRLDLLKQQKI